MAICLVGLGSNLGDRVHNLQEAVRHLREQNEIVITRVSSFLESTPVGGPPGQPNYFNAVVLAETTLAPHTFLATLQSIEDDLGRERRERWGPRIIDLDLLLYGQYAQEIIDSPELTVPHPRMHERRFVLDPAAEIACNVIHPVYGVSLSELLKRLPAQMPGELGLRVFTSASGIQVAMQRQRRLGQSIALVPTMGALHEGHLSLVRAAREQSDVTVATIFVNPTQFGPGEDFAKYPRTLEADLQALSAAGCDVVFVPEHDEMYPPGSSTLVEPPAVARPLEGVCRPGHFRGVATIVLKLFHLIPAHVAFFGQKDYQQTCVVRQMVRDLAVPIEIVVCPTVREPDGLAMSSRNRYLSPAERRQATALSRALEEAERLASAGQRDARRVAEAMRNILTAAGIERVDYATLADPDTLSELSTLSDPAVALIACYVGTTRLIDNRLISRLKPDAQAKSRD
jgi:pantoate--beta-alanine ligase